MGDLTLDSLLDYPLDSLKLKGGCRLAGRHPLERNGRFLSIVDILFHAVVGMKIHVTASSRPRIALEGPAHLHEE